MNNISNDIFESALADDGNRRTINAATAKYRKRISREELVCCGHMALLKCLLKHESHPASLYQRVVWECKKTIGEQRTGICSLPPDCPPSKEQPPEVTYVRDCLDTLPTKHSKIIHDYYIGRMTMQEIADDSGCSKVTIMKNLRTAEDAFRRLYGDD